MLLELQNQPRILPLVSIAFRVSYRGAAFNFIKSNFIAFEMSITEKISCNPMLLEHQNQPRILPFAFRVSYRGAAFNSKFPLTEFPNFNTAIMIAVITISHFFLLIISYEYKDPRPSNEQYVDYVHIINFFLSNKKILYDTLSLDAE